MHIIPPDFEKFPILSTAQYKPTPHALSDATKFYTQTSGLDISMPRMVLTQVSIYGKDNSALLSGLAELGPNGRAVVECDPEAVSVSQLETWWNQGVRGIRINLVSVGRSVTKEELQQMLQAYIDKLSSMKMQGTQKWVIEMYILLSSIPTLLSILPTLKNATNVRFVLDHFAGLMFKNVPQNFGPDDDPHLLPGFSELLTLLTDTSLPEVYAKISAAYRVDPAYPSADSLRRLGVVGAELVRKAEDRVMWASDWPHTRFENVDSVPFVEACYEWCGEGEEGERRRGKLFRGNAEVVWGMKEGE